MKCPKDGLEAWFSSASNKWVCPHCLSGFDKNKKDHVIKESDGK